MKFLFCNDSYPGQFGTMPAQLASGAGNEVMFLSFYPRQEAATPGIMHARLKIDRGSVPPGKDWYEAEWEKSVKASAQAGRTFCRLRDSGFVPDIVLVRFHAGLTLFLRHAFPDAFIVLYPDVIRSRGDSRERAARMQAMRDIQVSQMVRSNVCFVQSAGQKRLFPPLLHPVIRVCPPMVDTAFFSPGHVDLSLFFPDARLEEKGELLTFHMKGENAVDQQMVQMLLGLLVHRPACRIALSFGNNGCRRQWEALHGALAENLRHRLFIAGGLDRNRYRTLLSSSTVHVFPEISSLLIQEVLESMSCESLVMAPLAEDGDVLTHDTAVDFSEKDPAGRFRTICRVLDDMNAFDPVRRNGRRLIVEHYDEAKGMRAHIAQILKAFEDSRNAAAAD